MKIKTALILAGGDGDRFTPLKDKTRFKFNGESLLHIVARSVGACAEKIIIICNKNNADGLQNDLKDLKVTWVTQKNNAGGIADAVLAAESELTQDTIVLSGGDLFDFSFLAKLQNKVQTEKTSFGFIAKQMKSYFPGGYVRFEGERAVEILEKPQPSDIPSEYVRFVADYFPDIQVFIKEIRSLSSSDDQYERAMSALMQQKSVSCLKYRGDWATIKYSWHVLAIQEYIFKNFLKHTIDPSVAIHKTATVEGTVSIGKNVKIGAYVKIMGPCVIGENTIVGDHTLVRNSIIGEHCMIGSGSEVARSYLGNGIMLHRNYVGDSILGDNTTMGAGAVTANYRFDAKDIRTPIGGKMIDTQRSKCGLISGVGVRLGVNVTTYPGIKLSAGTIVLPGEVVTKDK